LHQKKQHGMFGDCTWGIYVLKSKKSMIKTKCLRKEHLHKKKKKTGLMFGQQDDSVSSEITPEV